MEKDRLLKLVEAYQEHFKQYNRPDYNETEVRNDFVNPFFEILGWDVQNKKNLPQHLREAVLNYWMIEMIVKSKASKFRGDYYSHGKQFVAQLPIYRINFDDSNEVKIHDEIVDTVKNLMKLKNKRDEQQTKPQKETYERLIQIEDNKLDGLISKLYGAENCRREDLDEE